MDHDGVAGLDAVGGAQADSARSCRAPSSRPRCARRCRGGSLTTRAAGAIRASAQALSGRATTATRSPTANSATPGPRASIVPALSVPSPGRKRLHGMLAAPHQDVAKIQRHGLVPDADLARTRLRQRHVLPAQHLGPAVLVKANGLHRSLLRRFDRTDAPCEKRPLRTLAALARARQHCRNQYWRSDLWPEPKSRRVQRSRL